MRAHPSLGFRQGLLGQWGGEWRGGQPGLDFPFHAPLVLEQSAPEERALFPRMYTGPREVFGWSLLGSPLPVGRGWNSGGRGQSQVLFHSGALALGRSHPNPWHCPLCCSQASPEPPSTLS